MNDAASQGPLILFSARGGMDIEDIAVKHPEALVRVPIDIRHGLSGEALDAPLPRNVPCERARLVDFLVRLYGIYTGNDAELLEVNPLVVDSGGRSSGARLQVRDG